MRLIDLYCCIGGASAGYAKAGFEVTGVDIRPQPDYPYRFIQGDAIEFIKEHGHEYDAIHASPPCQSSTALTKGTNARFGKEYPDLIAETRAALEATGKPYIIENVKGADLRKDLLLCGEMFGIRVIRHRFFEVNFPIETIKHIKHRGRVAGWRHGAWFEGPYFAVYGDGGGKGTLEQWKDAMEIPWATRKSDLVECLPVRYCEYIGNQLMKHLEN